MGAIMESEDLRVRQMSVMPNKSVNVDAELASRRLTL